MNKSIIFSLLFTLSFTACAKTASDNYFGEQQSSSKKEYESFRKKSFKSCSAPKKIAIFLLI